MKITTLNALNTQRKHFTVYFILLLSLILTTPQLKAEEWVYSTRPGDTIWDISKKYLKSVNYWSKVQKHNNVDIAKHLAPGTRLRIPLEWLKEPAATANVVSVTGQVEIETSSTQQPEKLSSRQLLNIGDTITTLENGSALIQFADGSTLLIQPNSKVKFNTLSSYGQTGMVDTQLRLQQGRVETKVTPLRDPASRYEITTPAAVAAVRGTEFRVAYKATQESMGSEVIEGAVNVAAEDESQNIEKGYGTITEKGKPPLQPVRLLEKPALYIDTDTIRHLPFPVSWEPLYGAIQYRIQLSPQDKPETLAYEFTHSKAQMELDEVEDGDYIIKVRAIDKLGLEGFNATRKLSINTDFPVVEIISPITAEEFSGKPYLFEWKAIESIEKYHFQLASDSSFNNILKEHKGSLNKLSYNTDLKPGAYYWRVAAIDEQGNYGKYTHADFSVRENPYEALMILLYLIPALLI